MNDRNTAIATSEVEAGTSLSYKFERLREKLRNAIISGDLAGKLPGERALAKRFHVNAKTLSKALTDLAAEGILDRSVGRGTFVKGSSPPVATAKRWLVVCDRAQADWDIIRLLRQSHADMELLTDSASVRPSFLNQFSSVIVLSDSTPDAFIRDLLVRNIPVVVVGKEPRTYSTHAVLFDGPLAVAMLGRDLLLGGHRRIAAIEPQGCSVVADTLRQAVARYSSVASIETGFAHDAYTLASDGVTAFVCHSVELAADVKSQLEKRGVNIPAQVSVAAVGSTPDDQPVSGYFMRRHEKAKAIAMLLRQNNPRPTTIWLAGKFVDRHTMAPVGSELSMNDQRHLPRGCSLIHFKVR